MNLAPQVTMQETVLNDSNPKWEQANMKVLLVRLSPWKDVDRSTPHWFLYDAIRRASPEVYLDWSFFPDAAARKQLEVSGQPWMQGSLSGKSVREFDLVLISNSCGVELINLPLILKHSFLELYSSQRKESDPLILLGGSNTLAAQALITETGDSFADAIFFGEGEGAVTRMAEVLLQHQQSSKQEKLHQIAKHVSGFWIAGNLGQTVHKAVCTEASAQWHPVVYPVVDSPQADTTRLQITMGCPCFCSFCFEGYDRKPYREVPLDELMNTARKLKANQGAGVVELYSFNFNSHERILELLHQLNHLFDQVSVKSQRMDFLDKLNGLYDSELLIDKRSFTLGIEGISERLRAYLNKSLDTPRMESCVESLLKRRVRQMKLFYLLTGLETEQDMEEFERFATWLRQRKEQIACGTRIIFSFGYLVRMPFTPLRHEALKLDPADWTQIAQRVKVVAGSRGFEFRIAADWDDYFFSQVVALGGYWLHSALVSMTEKGHFYDGCIHPGIAADLKTWMEENHQWTESFLSPKPADYPFPLAFLEGGVSEGFIYRQFQKSSQAEDTGYCLSSRCQACDACETPVQRNFLKNHELKEFSQVFVDRFRQRTQRKRLLKPIPILVNLPDICCWKSPEWSRAWLMRELLQFYPDQIDNILSVREILYQTGDLQKLYSGVAGWTVFGAKCWEPEKLIQAFKDSPHSEKLSHLEKSDSGDLSFQQIQLCVDLDETAFPNPERILARFLEQNYCPCQLQRNGPEIRIVPSPKALKKKQLLSGSILQNGSRWSCELNTGPKFDLLGWLKTSALLNWNQHAIAKVRKLEL